MTIYAGEHVMVRTATNDRVPRRAVPDVVQGEDFPVVWVTTDEEWEAAENAGTRPEAWPWPAEDVEAA